MEGVDDSSRTIADESTKFEKQMSTKGNGKHEEREKIYDDLDYIQSSLLTALEPIGLEIHPFLVGWYNEKAGPKFQLNYSDDTLAFVIINGPEMFEKCIVPYVKARLLECSDFCSNNVLDDSVKHALTIVKSDLKLDGFETEVLYDFDLYPSRRPKVLVQTAAHVAGAVQYLHKNNLPMNIQQDRFQKKSNLNGVAVHPKYGGWFAIRGVIIIGNMQVAEATNWLTRPNPIEIFTDPEQIARVLELFAYNWQTNEWRDVHKGLGLKYSDKFQEFLGMESSQRWEYVNQYCCSSCNDDDSL